MKVPVDFQFHESHPAGEFIPAFFFPFTSGVLLKDSPGAAPCTQFRRLQLIGDTLRRILVIGFCIPTIFTVTFNTVARVLERRWRLAVSMRPAAYDRCRKKQDCRPCFT